MTLQNEIRRALRFARAEAERRGLVGFLRFARIHSLDTQKGGEWLATRRTDDSYVLAWRVRSRDDEDEAKKNCDVVKYIDGQCWGFCFRERERL